jgi:solute carrier family 35 protein F5
VFLEDQADVYSFIGVLIVTHSDSAISSSVADADLPTRPLLGDAAALLSASFYAIYVVLLKVRVGDEDRADMQLMLG